MTAEIIAVCNQKGGSGKSTICMHIAAAFHEKERKVLVVDADPQNTLVRWSSSGEDQAFPVHVMSLAAAGKNIHREIAKYIGNYQYIFVDCPPSLDTPVPANVLAIAGLAIIPLAASPADLWATQGMRSLIERAQAFNPDLKAYFVLNMVNKATVLQREINKLLGDSELPMFAQQIALREAFKQVMALGTTVLNVKLKGAQVAADEIRSLANEVIAAIG